MKTRNRRISALAIALCMVLSLFSGNILPTLAAEDGEWSWGLLAGYKTIYVYQDENGSVDPDMPYYYAATPIELAMLRYREATRAGEEFFLHTLTAPFNIYYDLSGPNETIGTNMFCAGADYDIAVGDKIPVIKAADGKFLAGPFKAAGEEDFYYMDAPSGNTQGATGNSLLEGPEPSKTKKTDIVVLYNTENGTYEPLPEYILPGDPLPGGNTTPGVEGPDADGNYWKLVPGAVNQDKPDSIWERVESDGTPDLDEDGNRYIVDATTRIPYDQPTEVDVRWYDVDDMPTGEVDPNDFDINGDGYLNPAEKAAYDDAVKTTPTSVVITNGVVNLKAGETVKLIAEVSPSTAAQTVIWRSEDASIASVAADGTVTAHKNGTVKIIAETANGKTTEVIITIGFADVTGLSVTPGSMTIKIDEIKKLTATVSPSSANPAVSWSSGDDDVATVDANGYVQGVAIGETVITAVTNGFAKSCIVKVEANTVAVDTVSLNKNSTSINVGNTEKLNVTVNPSNASNQNVTWASSDSSVASVDQSGLVTAKTGGTAVITVTSDADSNKKDFCTVTVNVATVPVISVSLNKTSTTIIAGNTERLTATVNPSNATNQNVTWSSSNTSVATVNNNGNISAKAAGTTTITVTTEDGSFTRNCTVTVNAAVPEPSSIRIAANGIGSVGGTWYLDIGSFTFSAIVEPSNAPQTVTWTSSKTGVAAINATSGVVTFKKVGNTVITATANNGVTATYNLTIIEREPDEPAVPVQSVSLNKSSTSLQVGNTETLTATVNPSNATNKAVSWSSSNTSVATVNSNGMITARADGTTTITVTTADGSKKDTCSVTVGSSVTLNKSAVTLRMGYGENMGNEFVTLAAQVLNLSSTKVTWSSSNKNVATVTNAGLVSPISYGYATVTATAADGTTATCEIKVMQLVLSATTITVKVGNTGYITGQMMPDGTDVNFFIVGPYYAGSGLSSDGTRIRITPTSNINSNNVVIRTSDGYYSKINVRCTN